MINFGALLSNTSNFLYTYILIALLIFAGIYFTVRTRGVQFRLFPEALRVLGEKKKDGKDISSFQADDLHRLPGGHGQHRRGGQRHHRRHGHRRLRRGVLDVAAGPHRRGLRLH